MPQHPRAINITSFKGLENRSPPENTDIDFLKKTLNVNIFHGGISKRRGYSQVDTGDYTSLWASENGLGCYGVKNGDLVKIHEDYSTSIIKVEVGSEPLSFEEIDGIIYYTSIHSSGVIIGNSQRSFGIERNHLSPGCTVVSGALPAGTYQVNFTYVHSDGRESGCSRATVITVPANSGISVNIPTHPDPGVLFARVYCSTPDGNTLYYSGVGTLGFTYTISNVSDLIDPLRFFNVDAAPLGHICRYYRGRMYIASGNVLWYSEPFQYEQFRLDSNYFEFPEEIREVMPVEDGLWIGSDKLYYLSGEEPDKFKRSTKEHVKIVKGTSTRISGSYIHLDNTPIGYKWLVTSDLGIWVLFNQGLCINLTSENVSLQQADSGTSLFLQDEGMNQYMSILKTNQRPNNSVIGDLVETHIVRNGVIIQ